jgi:hypothetical protein
MVERITSYGAIVRCGPSEQRGLHRFFMENLDLVTLDYGGVLFATEHGLPPGRVTMDRTGQLHIPLPSLVESPVGGAVPGGGSLWRHEWRIKPCLWHGPGSKGKEAYPRLAAKWSEALRLGSDVGSGD